MSEALRTPEERFIVVPDFDYPPNYVEDLKGFEGLRMHLVDQGPARAEHVYLCLHGEPTWSFLYRKMAVGLLASGGRVVAPDFFGFGRSDKPLDDAVYTFDFHRRSLLQLISQRDLTNITLVCQDWGGLLGLTLPMEMPERFARMIVLNTTLATGDVPVSEGFAAWRRFVRDNPDLSIARLMGRACPGISGEELAGYEAPFPDDRYRAGVRTFPAIVPVYPDDPGAEVSRRARDWLSSEWSGKTAVVVGAQDPVLGVPAARHLAAMIRGAPEPVVLDDAGHFTQEAGGVVVAAALAAFEHS